MKKLLLFVAVLSVIALACNTASTPPVYNPPSVAQPVSQPTVSHGTSVAQVMRDNGFYDDGYECESRPCDSYTHDANDTYVSVLWYPSNSHFSLSMTLSDYVDIEEEGRVSASVIYTLYGMEVATWISDHMVDAVDGDQDASIDGYDINIGIGQYDDGTSFLQIIISP